MSLRQTRDTSSFGLYPNQVQHVSAKSLDIRCGACEADERDVRVAAIRNPAIRNPATEDEKATNEKTKGFQVWPSEPLIIRPCPGFEHRFPSS